MLIHNNLGGALPAGYAFQLTSKAKKSTPVSQPWVTYLNTKYLGGGSQPFAPARVSAPKPAQVYDDDSVEIDLDLFLRDSAPKTVKTKPNPVLKHSTVSGSPAIVQLASDCIAALRSSTESQSPAHVYKLFRGQFPEDTRAWGSELRSDVLTAIRMGLKLGLDEILIGPTEDVEDIASGIADLQDDWFIGSDADPEWGVTAERGEKSLFSLEYSSTERVYQGHQLTRTRIPCHVGKLGGEGVRAIWGQLGLELLYFTNDDEERYSIQANAALLRNITIQAAAPPLGYPVLETAPLSVFAL